MKEIIKIHPADNIAVALVEQQKGHRVIIDEQAIQLNDDIARGHKFALRDIKAGENIIKYGMPIGHALQDIPCGTHIHTQNLKTNLSDINEYEYQPTHASLASQPDNPQVNIFRRSNGDIAIRNEIWIVPTVGCVNALARKMIQKFEARHDNLDDIDGVFLYNHTYGCSQLGDDHLTTRTILQNLVHHPNAGGVLVVGLGCENNQITEFKKTLGNYDQERVRFMVCQQADDEIAEGSQLLEEIYQTIRHDQRVPGYLSEVKFGLECGGSDGLSGITANPLLGRFSDFLVAHGGTTVLTEVPEMFGAEQILMNQCQNEETYHKTVDMVNDFKRYFMSYDQPIYENPSPGNKAGGISTLEEKSLGCTQKAGTSQVVDVLKYGERLKTPGFNLLSAPGNDAIATSALGAAGCHMVLFTTGRGTPYGGFVPTVKIATNNELAEKKGHWIDFNAGALLTGKDMSQLLDDFTQVIVDAVNGKRVKNEINDFRELAIFKSGVTL
ncbi:UxaA family hydrolase [uncultured Cedecea sp.]|uniref:UxaA family hydrolase n=1 Tax=uncultured Cedecea sp. TaxID=988762 RepID=UPI0026305E1B|nr:altronate dehydratase family protein [uncultured Cedecea sp.]